MYNRKVKMDNKKFKNINAKNLIHCTGCGNCALSCPRNCIQMLANEEGFLYPYINQNLCIECGKCLNVCQIDENILVNKPIESFCVFNNNSKIWQKSASGGVAVQLAKWCISEKKGLVVGCEMTSEQNVQHTVIKNIKYIEKIIGSKYVQSDLKETFYAIENNLKDKKFCIFFGTPCQVVALNKYLFDKKINNKNLITVDIVCHGVPSPLFWKKCINYYKENFNLFNVKFRRKIGIPKKKTDFSLSFEKNKKKVVIPARCDAYYNLFMQCESLRESCYKCSYAKIERVSDITLGDCDSGSYYKKLGKGKAKSIVLLNTKKGKVIWEKVNTFFTYCSLNLEREMKINHQLEHPSLRTNRRNIIYKDVNSLKYEDLNKKYADPFNKKRKIAQILGNVLPNCIYDLILKIVK